MRTFILRHDDPISHEYAKTCADSCDALGIQWEYFEGFCGITAFEAYEQIALFPLQGKPNTSEINTSKNKAALCTASHVAIWKKIVEENIPEATILEHDAIMLDTVKVKLPDNAIVALGYKINDPKRYTLPKEEQKLTNISGISGSHAYALSYQACKTLLDGVKSRQSGGCIDSHVMMGSRFRNGLSMKVVDPIVSLGWIRKSTIWRKSQQGRMGQTIDSFQRNYR